MTNQEKKIRFVFFVKNMLFSVILKNLTHVLYFHLHKPRFFYKYRLLQVNPWLQYRQLIGGTVYALE